MTEEQLLEAMNKYDAVLPTVTDSISNKIISSDKRKAKIIGNFGVGFNNIDIESAKNNGVVVTKYSRSTNRLHSGYCNASSSWSF